MSRLSTFLEQYPNAEIRGGQILAIQQALGDVALPYFANAGLVDIHPDEWYSMTQYLKVIYDIVDHEPNVMYNLVDMGAKTIENAMLPPEIDSLEKGLMAMQQGWKMNSRNGKDVIWAAQKIDDHTYICSNYSPFPKDQEYGVLYGFARRFANGRHITVSYENLADRHDPDKEEVRFIVKVEEQTA